MDAATAAVAGNFKTRQDTEKKRLLWQSLCVIIFHMRTTVSVLHTHGQKWQGKEERKEEEGR